MPNRMLYTGLLTSKKIGELTSDAFELYIRLLLVVDDFGRYVGSPVRISRACYPDREGMTSVRIIPLLKKICDAELVVLYEIDGEKYIQMTNWNQRTRQGESKYPSNDGQVTVKCQSNDRSRVYDVDVDVDVDVCGQTRCPELKRSPDYEELFIIFWKEYPKKLCKEAALKAFKKLKPTVLLFSNIMDALAVQKQSRNWTKDDGQFVPNASTWLNGKRWEDEIAPTCTSGSGVTETSKGVFKI